MRNTQHLLVIIYDNQTHEVLKDTKVKLRRDIDYWVSRRIEKEGKYPEEIYLVDEVIDVDKAILRIEKKLKKDREKMIREDELKELDRLKKKYQTS